MNGDDRRFYLPTAPSQTGNLYSMPAAPNVAQPERVPPRAAAVAGVAAAAHQLAGTAGACRMVWNHILARQQHQYRAYRCGQDYKFAPEKAKPQLSFFSLNKDFTALRQDPEYAGLREYSFKSVRYVLKYLADAYQAFFPGPRGYPVCKRRHDHQDGVTI